ncbi:hypothetical protein CBL_20894, partial [Carabus blaptoides fortunei]
MAQPQGLNNKPEEEQVNSLIYLMGDQADDILVSFNLTTEEAKQYETVMRRFKEHFFIRNNVDQIKSNQRGKEQKWKKTKPQPNQVENTSKTAKKYMRCGKDHKRDQQNCPAINSTCHKCQETGHWTKVCRGAMINNQTITFKIDTGADVTVLPAGQYSHLFQQNERNLPTRTLYGAAHTKLQVNTMVSATLSYKDKKTHENIYLVERTIEPLLSRKASVALNLIARIHTIETNTSANQKLNPHQEFPELFKGIGRMPTEYEIKLKPGARP